ncbi:MAG: transposon-encoded TnpW family protein [Faecalibacterium prausnitzii]
MTEVRMGNTVLVVSGYFKEDTTATAADKMMKVLEAESSPPEADGKPHKKNWRFDGA